MKSDLLPVFLLTSIRILTLVIITGIIIGLSTELSINASAQTQTSIPNWVKNTAKLWSNGQINDTEYIKTLQWLVDKKILKVPQSTQNKTPAKQVVSLLYVNKAYNFSISKPAVWIENENTYENYGKDLGYVVLFTSPLQNGSGYITNINVNVKTYPGIQITANQLKGGFENGLHSIYATQDYFQITNKGSMTVNGKNSFFIEYGVKTDGIFVKSKQVVIPDGDRAFIITYTSTKEDYDKYYSQFTKTLSSFKTLG